MAQKKIGIYGTLQSTANNKVEDLYLIVDGHSIIFSVKNTSNNEYVAFEYFVNNGEQEGWNQLIAYLQNNSKLMHAVYNNVHFVMNTPRVVLSHSNTNDTAFQFQNELNLVHGTKSDEEIYTSKIGEHTLLVFGIPDALSTLLTRAFPIGKWSHYAAHLIKNAQPTGVYVQLFEYAFCLFVVEEGNIKLLNYAPLEGSDQNSYILLNSCINLGINTNTTPLFVAGYNEQQHDFIKKVAPYFENLSIVKAPNVGIGTNLNAAYPQHTYSTYFIF